MKKFILKFYAIGIVSFAFILLFDIGSTAQNVAAWSDRQGRSFGRQSDYHTNTGRLQIPTRATR